MKIAFVDYVLSPDKPGRSGLSDLVWDMATHLIDKGHDVHVVASYHTTDYPDQRVSVHNFRTPPIGYKNVVGQLWILKRAAGIVKQLKPDVVHAPEYVSTAVFHTLNVGTPLVLTVPGNIYHRLSARDGNSYEWLYTQILKWAATVSARHCASVIAISNVMKFWWEKTGSDASRTPMIPLGADPKRFRFMDEAKEVTGMGEDKTRLLFVGRFAKEKGVIDLLQALRKLDTIEQSRLSVTLVGGGPMREDIERYVRENELGECVLVREWLHPDQLSLWYSAADALVLPSHTEGLSRTILEAMLCGTPVIGTRISGTEDQVETGVTGFLYPDHDVEALAQILKDVVKNPDTLRGMRPMVRKYALENLTWERITERLVNEVYDPIISRV